MRKAKVLFKNREAGVLTQHNDGSFSFYYNEDWINYIESQSISLTLPKTKREFHSKYLFPFFFHMLPEGSNKEVVCKHHRIDPEDHFGLLLTTAKYDSIGAVRIIKLEIE